jgi:hypothetical protein
VCISLFLPFANVAIDVHHDGLMLKPALDVLAGQALHRQTFTQYGPLTTLVHAGALAVFGGKLLVLRIVTIVAEGAAIGLLTLAWRSLLPWRTIWAMVFLWCALPYFYSLLWPMHPWSSSVAMFFQAACLLGLARAFQPVSQNARVALVAVAGVCASATFWCRQPVGGLLAIAGATVPIALQFEAAKSLTGWPQRMLSLTLMNPFLRAYTLGGIGFALLMVAWLINNGALSDWYVQNILWPRSFASGLTTWTATWNCFFTPAAIVPAAAIVLIGLAIQFLWPLATRPALKAAGLLVFGLLWLGVVGLFPGCLTLNGVHKMIPLATCGLLAALALTGKRETLKLTVTHGVLCPALVSWAQFYPVNCIRHNYWSLAPIVGVFVFLLGKGLKLRAGQLSCAVILFSFPLACLRVQDARQHFGVLAPPLTNAAFLDGMRPYREVALTKNWIYGTTRDIEWFNQFRIDIQNRTPEAPIVLYGRDALLPLAAMNRENPGPWYVHWADLAPFCKKHERNRFILERKPIVLLQMFPGAKPELSRAMGELGYVTEFRGRAFLGDMYVLWPHGQRMAVHRKETQSTVSLAGEARSLSKAKN